MDAQRICPTCGKTLAPTTPQGLCPACLLAAGFATGANTANAGSSRPVATRFIAPRPEELAALFPQLEILSLLGQGGMGAVYRARQPSLDRLVALKILPPSSERDAAFEERFMREARALARLLHPNIVAVHDFGAAGGYHYFIMEFVDGVTLRHVLATTHTTPREALAIVPQICDALQYAHDKGIVHRDIKPENILIDRTGAVKIADFGLAKLVGADSPDLAVTGARDVMGTPHYMAPEQVEHPLEVDHRADIYSLGVVFYQMLTGELPLGRFAPPSRKVQVDVRLDDVVLRALEKEPELRYQQASGLRTAVETIATTKAPAHRVADAANLWRRRPGPTIAAVACLTIVALGGTIAGLRVWPSRPAATGPVISNPMPSHPAPGSNAPARSTPVRSAAAASGFTAPTPVPAESELASSRVRNGMMDAKSESDADPRSQQRARQARPQSRVGEPEPVSPAIGATASPEPIPPAPAATVNRGHYALTRAPADYDAMESNPEILRIQLRQAEAEKDDVEHRASLGVATRADVQRAEERMELFRARLEGDRVRFARVKLAAARQRLDEVTARYNAGLASGMDVQLARDDVQIEQARLRETETRAARDTTKP